MIIILSGFNLVAHTQARNLEYYLAEGLRNSPLINEFKNKLSSSQADSLLIRAARKPFVEARSQLLYSPFYKDFGYDEVITDGGNYTAVMGVTQNILNRSEINNKLEAVDIQKKSINNSTKITVNELNKIITGQYLVTFSDFSDLSFNRSYLDLFRKENDIVEQFVKNGVYKQTDYLALIIETESQEILVSQLESQSKKDLMLLNQICGITDTSAYEVPEPLITVNGIPDITKSSSYLQYKIDSIRINNAKTFVDIRYKPRVNWFADAGFLTSNPWNFYKHFGYSVGVGMTIPVYDGRQKVIEKRKLEFDENSRKMYETTYKNQYFQQIRQLNNDLKSLNDMSLRMEKQLKTSEQLVKALKDQLEAGIIQMTDYINAVKNFRTMSRNLNMVNIQKLQVINEMNFLLTR